MASTAGKTSLTTAIAFASSSSVPASSEIGGKGANSLQIGLGVGLGVGIPLLLAAGFSKEPCRPEYLGINVLF